jgi:hypothetical protein
MWPRKKTQINVHKSRVCKLTWVTTYSCCCKAIGVVNKKNWRMMLLLHRTHLRPCIMDYRDRHCSNFNSVHYGLRILMQKKMKVNRTSRNEISRGISCRFFQQWIDKDWSAKFIINPYHSSYRPRLNKEKHFTKCHMTFYLRWNYRRSIKIAHNITCWSKAKLLNALAITYTHYALK